jgi:hypothetical protein
LPFSLSKNKNIFFFPFPQIRYIPFLVMNATATPTTLPAPCRVQISKTVYQATAKPWENAPGSYFWELVAIKGTKQVKSLFPDFSENYSGGMMTLYSKQNGMRGPGLPKLVTPIFFQGPQA